MNQLIAVLQDVDMRLGGTDCRSSHNYYSDKLRGGKWQHRHINRRTLSNRTWQPKVNRSFLHVFIPTFELLFVVIRRPSSEPQTG